MKIDPTTRYLNQRRATPDYIRSMVEPMNTSPNRMAVPRLCFSSFAEPLPFSYDEYAKTITSSSLNDHAFFLDTCFVKKEVPQDFWDALSQRTVCITHWIDFELCQWKANPNLNLGFHARYVEAQGFGNPSIQFLPDPGSESPMDVAIRHYIGLLGLRKNIFAIIRDKLQSQTGRPPKEEDVHARVQKIVKDRGMQIAAKGNKDTGKANFLADEDLVVQAFAYALSTGRDVTVLTRDRDLSEQFYKTQYLLDTHYRSLLLADAFVKQPMNFLPASDGSFLLPGFESMELYRMPAGMDKRVLKADYQFVNVHVDRIVESGSELGYTSLRFAAETEMARVLIAKGETNGLNTSALAGRNLHRCVHPHMQSDLGGYMAIVEDCFVVDGDLRWSELDTEIVLTPCESGAAIKSHKVPSDGPSQDTLRQAVEISGFCLPKRLTPTFSLDYVRTSQAAVALSVEMMEPWNRYLVSSELIEDLPDTLKAALCTHDCHVLPAHVPLAHKHGLQASATREISAVYCQSCSRDTKRVLEFSGSTKGIATCQHVSF